MNNFIAYE